MNPYYQDDAVTIYHGDALEIALSACPAPAVILTDPPYGIGWEGSNYRNPSKASGITGDLDTSARDALLDLYPDTPAIVFGSIRAPFPAEVRAVLSWKRAEYGTGLVGNRLPWLRDWDPIFICGPWPDQTPSISGVIGTRSKAAAAYSGYITRAGHPHAKPVDTLIDLLDASPHGLVLDPFAGSGSTLVAAKAANRRAIGIEIEERYCEIAARRCSQEVLGLAV